MADKEDLISQLAGITGCTADQARFFLEANKWDIQEATSSFYEAAESGGTAAAGGESSSQAEAGPFQASGPFAGTGSFQQSSGSSGNSSKARKAPTNSSRVKTFSEMISGDPSDSDGTHSDDDEQTFYTGGEKSGLLMQDRPKNPDDLVKNILEKAARAGPPPEESRPSAGPSHFGGAGYRLGSEEEPVDGPSVPVVQAQVNRPQETIERRLIFWRNGFTIDDGELRSYEAPESQEFLRAINSGRAPTTLLNVAYDQPVEVKVTRNLEQDYTPPARKAAPAFSGSGQRLGSISVEESNLSIPGAFPGQAGGASASGSTAAAPASAAPIPVDASQPSTSIQVRLADGSRLVVKVNHTHTVGDVRRYINGSRPDITARKYVLQLSYPVKELADDNATVKDAGLINAVIVQRYV
ncbi:hypothetical protein PhCBS80983_g00886 [Powellomyces hirtus]|uniref:SEP domain-containing protein n=1 Tax=Powellomyces hirtus TaxID=109895 RepID=A0A507EEN0_9FUNG|nr:hypothetical protein PhCBS80983_g00886 [Powellomyces hirtus]